MKKTLACAFLAVLCVAWAAPSARALGVYGIWWMPDNSDDDGWGIGIKDTRKFTPLLSVDGRVGWVSFSTPDTDIIPLEATALVHLAMWYGGIGGGYYFFTGDTVSDSWGWYALLGLEIGLGKTGVFGEVKWQGLSPDIGAGSKISGDFDSVVIHAGATFGIPGK